MATTDEPILEKSITLPFGYALTARARPSTIKSTAIRLLPWALYVAMPKGGAAARLAFLAANRVSPLLKQKMRA